MGIISRTKKVVKPFVDARSWSGYDDRRDSWRKISHMAKRLFTVSEAKQVESFEEAKVRLKLSESDIKHRVHEFFRLAMVFLFFGMSLLLYSMVLAWTGHMMAVILAFVASLLTLTLAFRYHFWYFQTKNQKLGCTFDEWLNSDIKGEQ